MIAILAPKVRHSALCDDGYYPSVVGHGARIAEIHDVSLPYSISSFFLFCMVEDDLIGSCRMLFSDLREFPKFFKTPAWVNLYGAPASADDAPEVSRKCCANTQSSCGNNQVVFGSWKEGNKDERWTHSWERVSWSCSHVCHGKGGKEAQSTYRLIFTFFISCHNSAN